MTNFLDYLNIIHNLTNDYVHPIDKGTLGHGLILVPLDIKDNNNKYGNLFRNEIKLSEIIFRIGGLSTGFNGKLYCNLIQYDTVKSHGRHCIINSNGDIVLIQEEKSFDYPFYHKGCIASIKNRYYNLLTGKFICKGNHRVNSENYLFIENSYNWDYEKEYQCDIGVYKIYYSTGEFEIFK